MVQNCMALIIFSAVFFTPGEIFLRDLLKLSMRPRTLKKVMVPFSYGEVKEHVQKVLNSLGFSWKQLKVVKYRELSTQRNIK